jgi:succinoglycan biosynthesis protein ExoM
MNHIVIGIPTYKRPRMLEKLIKSIYASQLDTSIISSVHIVIVDNDSNKTAELIANNLQLSCPEHYQFHYYSFPIKGLSNVRNEIISKSLAFNPDYIIFVDDDEYVTDCWLNELVKTIQNNDGDFVVGPVIPIFEQDVASSISLWFKREEIEDQERIGYLNGAGNLIMRTKFLKDHRMEFDPRFNTTGAEDSYFGVSALKKGANIFWAAKAIAYETISVKRWTLNWLIKRTYRGAITYTYILLLERKYGLLAKKIIVNFIYMLVGILSLVIVPFNVKYRYYGPLKIAESIGGFAGLLNIKYQEYSKTIGR